MNLRAALAAMLLVAVASCGETPATTTSDDIDLDDQAAPVGHVYEWAPIVATGATVSGETGSTQLVEVTVMLAFGDEPLEVEVEAYGLESMIPVTPDSLTLVPGVASTLEVPIVFDRIDELENVDVSFQPVVGADGFEKEGATGRIVLEELAMGAPVPPLVTGDMAELGESVLVDVLANDVALQGSLDPDSLRIVSVMSEQLTVEDFAVESGGIRLIATGEFWDGAWIEYEVCDTTGLCNIGKLLWWLIT